MDVVIKMTHGNRKRDASSKITKQINAYTS